MYNRVLFIGSKESGFKVLETIYRMSRESLVGCVTVDDCTDSRSYLKEFKEFCIDNDVESDVLNGKCNVEGSIEKFKPDICFVMGWYYLIPDRVLKRVKGGFVGIHNSLLPKHRGFAPVVWAMILGEKYSGFSVFLFEKGMDTGDILFQKKVPILEEDYVYDVLKKIDNEVEVFFRENYLRILSGELEAKKQGHSDISYCARRVPEDGEIDWNKQAHDIYNFVRAQSRPYPGAYTYYRGEKYRIWRADVFEYPVYGSPGQIVLMADRKVIIACGENTGLVVSELEKVDSDEKIDAVDLINTLNFKMGK